MPTQAELIVQTERQALDNYAELTGFEVITVDSLTFVARSLQAANDDRYAIHVHCDDYKVMPPIFRWCAPDTFELERPSDIPLGEGGYFHSSDTLCAPWNRNSYKKFRETAPHGDWDFTNWQNNPKTGRCTTLPRMFARICSELKSDRYKRRKA